MLDPTFPSNFKEFSARFHSEEACRDYVAEQKWGDARFKCAHCGSKRHWKYEPREVYMCARCDRQTTLRAGTLFHGSKKPLMDWFLAIWLFTSSKRGISAKELQRQLGYGSYQTAWTMLHKVRKLVVVPGRSKLQNEVEVDEAYVGASEQGVKGRGTNTKKIVVCAVERGAWNRTGRVRLRTVKKVDRLSLCGFIQDVVEPGTLVHTDNWRSYWALPGMGYFHVPIISPAKQAHQILPRVHRVFSHLKRWLLGTHQGAVREKHLDAYLHEYEFRFNRRKAKSLSHTFQRLMEQAGGRRAPTFAQIVA